MIALPLHSPLITADLQDVIVVNAWAAVVGDYRVHCIGITWAFRDEVEPRVPFL